MTGSEAAAPVSALTHYTRPLERLLADPEVTEICLQRPGELWVERGGGWSVLPAPWATLHWAQHFARLVATRTEQKVGAETPLLSASLPGGERLQFVLPPATAAGCVVLSLRRDGHAIVRFHPLGGEPFDVLPDDAGGMVRIGRTDDRDAAAVVAPRPRNRPASPAVASPSTAERPARG